MSEKIEKDILNLFPLTGPDYYYVEDIGDNQSDSIFYIYPNTKNNSDKKEKIQNAGERFVASKLAEYGKNTEKLLNDFSYSCLIAMLNEFINQKQKMIRNEEINVAKEKLYEPLNVLLVPFEKMLFDSDYNQGDSFELIEKMYLEGINADRYNPAFIGMDFLPFIDSYRERFNVPITEGVLNFISGYVNRNIYNDHFDYEFVEGKRSRLFRTTCATYRLTPSKGIKLVADCINKFEIKGLDFKFTLEGFVERNTKDYTSFIKPCSESSKIYNFGDAVELKIIDFHGTKDELYKVNKDMLPLPYYGDYYCIYGKFEVTKCELLEENIKSFE